MPDLDFQILSVEPLRDPATPALAFRLQVTNSKVQEPIYSIVLRCQIQIETARRRYSSQEQKRLHDLFGEPEQWAETLRSMLWANVTANIPSFTGSIIHPVPVLCAVDLTDRTAKYFNALEGGEVPIIFLFSGRVFYDSRMAGGVQVAPVPWSKEARFRFPVAIWSQAANLLEVS